MGKKKDRLKIMSVVMKVFAVATYVTNWYAGAQADQVITKEELADLGLGICDILGLNTDIDLD